MNWVQSKSEIVCGQTGCWLKRGRSDFDQLVDVISNQLCFILEDKGYVSFWKTRECQWVRDGSSQCHTGHCNAHCLVHSQGASVSSLEQGVWSIPYVALHVWHQIKQQITTGICSLSLVLSLQPFYRSHFQKNEMRVNSLFQDVEKHGINVQKRYCQKKSIVFAVRKVGDDHPSSAQMTTRCFLQVICWQQVRSMEKRKVWGGNWWRRWLSCIMSGSTRCATDTEFIVPADLWRQKRFYSIFVPKTSWSFSPIGRNSTANGAKGNVVCSKTSAVWQDARLRIKVRRTAAERGRFQHFSCQFQMLKSGRVLGIFCFVFLQVTS